jgi:uncharacterized membrane protein
MDGALFALTLVTALGCGTVGGALFAFSAFVMKALHRLPAAQGIAAMQSINVVAVTPVFMIAVFGTAAASAAVIVATLVAWNEPSTGYLLAGGALYLVGTIAVTMAFNVSRNNALAVLRPDSPDAATQWDRYVAEWTGWNHVRTAAAIAAAALLTIALGLG